MQKWEYMFVSAALKDKEWRIKKINGKEQAIGKTTITLYDYANQMGDEGWELISAPYTADEFNSPTPRLIFKRPKSS